MHLEKNSDGAVYVKCSFKIGQAESLRPIRGHYAQ